MSEEEFEKQTLNNLITDLKDIDKYTSFKNGAFIYDLGKYQGTLLVNHIEQLQIENKKLEDLLHKANDEVISYTNCCIDLKEKIDKAIEYIKHNQNNREGLSITEYHKKWLELYDYYESESIMKDLLEILGEKENE